VLCKRKRWMSGPRMTNPERVGATRRRGTASPGRRGAFRLWRTAPPAWVGAVPVRIAAGRGDGHVVRRRKEARRALRVACSGLAGRDFLHQAATFSATAALD
jgi:hypothetical protein